MRVRRRLSPRSRPAPLHIGLILCIHREEGVVVAVAYMSQDRPVQTASLYGFAGMPQGSRQIGDRDAYIGSHHAFIGKEAVYREAASTCLPELLPSGFVFLKIEGRTVLLVAELAGFLNVACYAGRISAELEEQGGSFRMASSYTGSPPPRCAGPQAPRVLSACRS